MRTLTSEVLNRTLLARQGLIDRWPTGTPLTTVLEGMGGLQAQYAPSIYVGLWSRVDGIDREAVTAAIEDRTAIQGTLMRSTIHLVSRDDYWPIALGVREARRRAHLRAFKDDPSRAALEDGAAIVRARIAADGPITRKEVEALIGKDRARAIHVFLDLVRVPPYGTWERRRADLYGLAADWVGPEPADDRGAVGRLVTRYLEGFGPAPIADIATWAGLTAAEIKPALADLDLVEYAAGSGPPLLDLAGLALADADTPAPPAFLGHWDAALLVHARRTGVLPEEHRKKIFHVRAPHSFAVFLVDGRVAGTWRHEDGRVALEPFARLGRADRTAVERAAEPLARFLR